MLGLGVSVELDLDRAGHTHGPIAVIFLGPIKQV